MKFSSLSKTQVNVPYCWDGIWKVGSCFLSILGPHLGRENIYCLFWQQNISLCFLNSVFCTHMFCKKLKEQCWHCWACTASLTGQHECEKCHSAFPESVRPTFFSSFKSLDAQSMSLQHFTEFAISCFILLHLVLCFELLHGASKNSRHGKQKVCIHMDPYESTAPTNHCNCHHCIPCCCAIQNPFQAELSIKNTKCI